MSITHKLDLLENGLDFIISGVDYLIKNEAHSHKYAILHLEAGVELVLKHVVQEEHWSLLFEDPNKANREQLESGGFKSIDFESIINRIKNICKVPLTQEEERSLRNLRNLRNKIQHFRFDINILAVRSDCSHILYFLQKFIIENCNLDSLSDTAKKDWELFQERSKQIDELVKVKLNKLKPAIEEAKKQSSIFQCPNCTHPTFVVNESMCLFCDYTDTPDEVANLYAENILGENAHASAMDGGEFPVVDCLRCYGIGTMVISDAGLMCFNCGETIHPSKYKYCSSCGQLMERTSDGESMCENCWEYVMDKD